MRRAALIAVILAFAGGQALAEALPTIEIGAAKPRRAHVAAHRAPPTHPAHIAAAHVAAVHVAAPAPAPRPVAPKPSAPPPAPKPLPLTADEKVKTLDQARENLQPKIGASTYTLSREAIETLPQGDNTPIDKVILQAPGVSYDSALANPSFHIRNEYANVQYRIDGVVLPEGVSSLGPVLDTSFVGKLNLIDGALPAQYGLRTSGVIDITSRSFADPQGSVIAYGGVRETATTSFDYGGAAGDTRYFVTARGNWSALGLENPTQSYNAAHDHTEQGKYFAYLSTLLGDFTRLSFMSGASSSNFQIPNNPGQTALGDFGPSVYPSSIENENEYDKFLYNIAALQTKVDAFDGQIAIFQRHASTHFVPDIVGDLIFNDVASNVIRESDLYGVQADGSYRLNDAHRLRGGFAVTGEKTNVTNLSTLLPVDPTTGAIGSTPFQVTDFNAKLGWNIGGYVQDEWKLNEQLVVNAGARFDQLYQFVDANQLSPRLGLVYKPIDGTTLHAGYARYFTPPMQSQAAPPISPYSPTRPTSRRRRSRAR